MPFIILLIDGFGKCPVRRSGQVSALRETLATAAYGKYAFSEFASLDLEHFTKPSKFAV